MKIEDTYIIKLSLSKDYNRRMEVTKEELELILKLWDYIENNVNLDK